MNIMKYLYLLLLCCSLNSYSQSSKEIDSLLVETNILYSNGRLVPAIEKAFGTLEISRKAGYEKGTIKSLMFIAHSLSLTSQYEKSIEYIEQIETHRQYFETHPFDLWLVQRIKIDNIKKLGYKVVGSQIFNDAFATLSREKDSFKKAIGLYNMYMIGATNSGQNRDTAYKFLNLTREIVESAIFLKDKPKHLTDNHLMLWLSFGDYFFAQERMDSASHYYLKASRLIGNDYTGFHKADVYDALGKIAFIDKDYKQAVEYKLAALKFYQERDLIESSGRMYKELNQSYTELNDKENALKYLELYQSFEESLTARKQAGRDKTVLNMVMKHESLIENAHQTKSMYKWVAAAAVSLLIVLVFLVLRFRKTKDNAILEQENVIKDNNSHVAQLEEENRQLREKVIVSDEKLDQMQDENNVLKLQINSSFEEVIVLAKENSPQFWTRFREIYPGFQEKMLELNSQLKVTELTLCAYIFLGFSSKEIASHTFKSVKTIENNRIHLRKKLNLSQEENLTVWLKTNYG